MLEIQDNSQKVHPLRAWRLNKKLTLQAAAQKIGVSHVTWHKWEKGQMKPDADNERRLYEISSGALTPNVLRGYGEGSAKARTEQGKAA